MGGGGGGGEGGGSSTEKQVTEQCLRHSSDWVKCWAT